MIIIMILIIYILFLGILREKYDFKMLKFVSVVEVKVVIVGRSGEKMYSERFSCWKSLIGVELNIY